ncbi:MAG: Sigma54 specific transcriptional regulator, Fis family protein [uncultured Aureispira sp.]|uniref:Sigma54 specific transcriptional regulator, Fis family protein n=1 Tax=uncultured Aureispira sp. TaxID=1331704 RepID=A0A6S6UC66_9BACT|nr:MAG: Sigma54 specific transcriptional regulator, Fis family protein [uncultured Aureispira sp.]
MNLQTIKQRFGIIGNSATLNHALKIAMQVAPTDLSVLIEGASGVGKESFSKIIHNLSSRKHQKFIAINCGALPESTLYSELFGHTKNAFTGATTERKGYFETVNGGTIFLDEIGEMPPKLQQFLLRVLEQGEFVKMGSNKVETTDVRVIAATNVKLLENVQQGKFREDLYYRLNTVPIKVPPLKDRSEDIHILFRKFAADFAERYKTSPVRLDERAQLLLENYTWPGNIRELKNIALQISALSENKSITAEALLEFIPKALDRNLPALSNQFGGGFDNAGGSGFYEREILFKFLYEMKKDLADLKTWVAEIAQTNNLQMPNGKTTSSLTPVSSFQAQATASFSNSDYENDNYDDNNSSNNNNKQTPIIINTERSISNKYSDVEEIEESLSIEDMEQELIKKALIKHRGKRKEAAKELGISERTLYRKIRQYEIEA